jgi:hypothetical protein
VWDHSDAPYDPYAGPALTEATKSPPGRVVPMTAPCATSMVQLNQGKAADVFVLTRGKTAGHGGVRPWPQCAHRSRRSSRERGNARPRVHTSVSISNTDKECTPDELGPSSQPRTHRAHAPTARKRLADSLDSRGTNPCTLGPKSQGRPVNKIANIENVVCSVETMARHPELYHYTKTAAFEGIVRSQTLWCSHYRAMTDDKEIRLARGLLQAAVAPRMNAIIKERFNRKIRRTWDASGGGDQTARDLVDSLYGATFDGKAVYSALAPYLFSFSTHADDTAFAREHGVRSQWESYAGPEGYCLVFDIGKIADTLKQEGNARYWAWLMLEPVRYADRPIEEIFPELVSGLAETLRQLLLGVKEPEAAASEFLNGTTLLKGADYKTEREVRIVAIPGTAKLALHAAKEYSRDFDAAAPLPEIKTRPDSDKRYVALFDGLSTRLPIKRIIVGPGGQQHERAAWARSILGDVPVTVSECADD